MTHAKRAKQRVVEVGIEAFDFASDVFADHALANFNSRWHWHGGCGDWNEVTLLGVVKMDSELAWLAENYLSCHGCLLQTMAVLAASEA